VKFLSRLFTLLSTLHLTRALFTHFLQLHAPRTKGTRQPSGTRIGGHCTNSPVWSIRCLTLPPPPPTCYRLHCHYQALQAIAFTKEANSRLPFPSGRAILPWLLPKSLLSIFHTSDHVLWKRLQSWKSHFDRTPISIHKDKSFI